MIIQYDEGKKNIRKHGLSFETAMIAFDDRNAVVIISIQIPKNGIVWSVQDVVHLVEDTPRDRQVQDGMWWSGTRIEEMV